MNLTYQQVRILETLLRTTTYANIEAVAFDTKQEQRDVEHVIDSLRALAHEELRKPSALRKE